MGKSYIEDNWSQHRTPISAQAARRLVTASKSNVSIRFSDPNNGSCHALHSKECSGNIKLSNYSIHFTCLLSYTMENCPDIPDLKVIYFEGKDS